MNGNENRKKTAIVLVGFAAGVLTVLIIVFAMKGC
jgi:hypothetical protein